MGMSGMNTIIDEILLLKFVALGLRIDYSVIRFHDLL